MPEGWPSMNFGATAGDYYAKANDEILVVLQTESPTGVKNAEAIARVVAGGAVLSVLPDDVVKALRAALETVLDEEAAASPQFKKVLTDWRAFRANQHRWFSIADTRAELAVYRSAS